MGLWSLSTGTRARLHHIFLWYVPSIHVYLYELTYSIGISGDSTFEAELLQNTRHCEIWGYDFSVKGFTNDIPHSEKWRTNFQPYGLAGRDISATQSSPAMYTLKSLMEMNGECSPTTSFLCRNNMVKGTTTLTS